MATALVITALAVMSRIPAIGYGMEINRDESQMLAQAMRYSQDLVPWRAVDGTTSGPLNSWFLLAVHAVGFKLTYGLAHALAALANAASLFALFISARRWLSAHVALMAIGISAAWLALNQTPDFVHYSSEAVPVLLISVALALAKTALTGRLIAAFLLGMVPWAKLQAAPIAAVVGVWLIFDSFRAAAAGELKVNRWVAFAGLVVVALLPSGGFALLLHRGDAVEDFLKSYLVANLHYAGPMNPRMIVVHLVRYLTVEAVAPWLGAIGLLFVAAHGWTVRVGGKVPALTWFCLVLLSASLLVCGRSQTFFPHYQLLLLPGLFLVTAVTLARLACERADLTSHVLLAVGVFALTQTGGALRAVRDLYALPSPSAAARIVREISRVAPGVRSVCVWGWAPSIYMEMQLPPTTRHAISHYLMEPNPSREFLRESFLRDLQTSQPDMIIDLSGAYGGPSENTAVASFPRFQDFLVRNYYPPRIVNVPDVAVDVAGDIRLKTGTESPLSVSLYLKRGVASLPEQ